MTPAYATLMVAGGKLWWADEDSGQLGTVTKRDGRNLAILRNKTAGVIHMKVYDREGQKGTLSSLSAPQKRTWTAQACGSYQLLTSGGCA